ncbi:MAG: PEP-CTERM sorting domain-containing protein [Planctomycetia bacterium]|nr:PEP-CTERM sorting domain-containing protein [Planctomycetia bacterium]
MIIRLSRKRNAAAAALAAWLSASPATSYGTTFFYEDFDGVTLKPAVNEAIPVDLLGWTDVPPAGWTVDDSGVPGALSGDDLRDGRTEWAGWSFASKEFWTTADDQGRTDFDRASGNVAVADPDEWDDQAHDPITSTATTYNARMATPTFSVAGFRPGKLFLTYDSSFRPEGPDDNADAYNDQSPVVRASWGGAANVEILRWTSDPAAAMGGTVMREDNNTNDSITIPLTVPAGATTLKLDFGLERAENDWWWAIDNVAVADALPKFKVVIDSVDGDVALVNGSNKPLDLKGYTITSASGSLLPANWDSLQSSGDAGAGWLTNVNASTGNLTETNLNGSFLLEPGDSLYLGKLFKLGDSTDGFALQILEAGKPAAASFVEIDDFTPDTDPGQLGDTDNDDDVDITDLNNVRNNFSGNGLGDTDGDNDVDITDLNNVRNNFGAVPGANAVPEPSTFGLLGLGAIVAGWFTRRRR